MHGTAQRESDDIAGSSTRVSSFGFWLGVLMALAASLPVLMAWSPQMTDYPSHLAGFKVMLDHGADPFLTKYFTFEWEWTGNLGAELAIVPLAPIFGLEMAGRIITGAIPLLTGLGILAVARALRRPVSVGDLLAFSMIWSPSLLLGFLNYSLSIAIGLFAFALWVKLEDKRWRPAVFVPIGFVVWLCHVSGWGVLGVMVFGYEWHRDKSWRAFVAPWPLIFPIAPMLFGMGSNAKMSYGSQLLEYKWAILYRAMRSYDYWVDIVSLCAVMLVVLGALVMRKIDGRLGWAALGLLALSMAMPRHIFGGDYADYRLTTSALLVACLAINWRMPRWALVVAAGLFFARLGLTTYAWHEDAVEAAQLVEALEYVPEGARVATAVAIPRRRWSFGSFEHFGSYAVVRRSAKENSNFALPDVHMLAMRDRTIRFADPTQRILYAPSQRIDLRRFPPARHADFLWYIGTVRPATLPVGARIVFATENSFLARLAKRRDPR